MHEAAPFFAMSETVQMERWLRAAKSGEPVWLADVREACRDTEGARPVVAQLTCPDGAVRDFPFSVPPWTTREGRGLAAEYIRACVFNILSVHSGRKLAIFSDRRDGDLNGLLDELPAVFQLDKASRTGYGKVINIADRLCRSMGLESFTLSLLDIGGYTPAPPAARRPATLEAKLRRAADRAGQGLLGGVDVGGTDVKLVLVRHGRLLAVRVLDWDPASGTRAEDTLDYTVLLASLYVL